jgi:hypothetical protein
MTQDSCVHPDEARHLPWRASTFFALCCALLVPSAAHAGPWVKDAGQGYVKLGAGVFSSDKIYDVSGELQEVEFTYGNRSVGLYGELGVGADLGVMVSTSVYDAANTLRLTGEDFSKVGFGDLDLGVQWQAWRGEGCVAALNVWGRVPLYSGVLSADAQVGTSGDALTREERYRPALGDGSYDVTLLGAAGCSLYPFPGWVAAQAGPKLRTRGFGSGATAALDIGAFVWPERLALTLRADTILRFSADNERPTKWYVSVGGGAIIPLVAGAALELNASYIPVGAFVAQGWSAGAGFSWSGGFWGGQK